MRTKIDLLTTQLATVGIEKVNEVHTHGTTYKYKDSNYEEESKNIDKKVAGSWY